MAVVSQIESIAEASELQAYLDKATTANFAGIEHEPVESGATLRFFEEELSHAETGLWVARDGDAVLGLCLTGAWVAPISGERMAAVLALYVEPNHRHRGIAKSLVQSAQSVLRARGVSRLGARVEHNDDARISMGERWGWTRGWEWLDSGPSS
jgi:ribosomal protein S18 acetylase RimI-like enzyme